MIFTTDDVISLDYTLSPIILAGLKKFKEELLKDSFGSFPSDMLERIGAENPIDPTIEEHAAAWDMWLEVLDKMIYAFDPSEEPNMDDYGFSFEYGSIPTREGFSRMNIDVTDKSEYDRFRIDEEDWERKCKEGRMLLAEFFDSLWI